MTEALIQTIRAATTDGASDEARAAGAAACRTLLGVLEARCGDSFALPQASPPASPIAAVVGAVRHLPAEQVLDLLIAKLRTVMPPDDASAQSFKLAIPVIAPKRSR